MKHLYTWSAILVIALASVVGDVLISHAMKQVGDVGLLRRRAGLWTVVGRVVGNRNFVLGVAAMAVGFFSLLFALSWGDVQPGWPCGRVFNLHRQCLRRENISA